MCIRSSSTQRLIQQKKGSPTKSTQRYRWRELLPWDVEAEARAYWDALSEDRKDRHRCLWPDTGRLYSSSWTAILNHLLPNPGCESHSVMPSKFLITLRFEALSDVHAEMWTEGSQPDPQPLANADFIMVYDGKLCGLIELKTWWKVTEAEIEEVRSR